MNDELLEPRLSRAAALRLAAAGAAGLALGVRPAHAAPSDAAAVEAAARAFLKSLAAGRASSCVVCVRERRAHALALDRAVLRAAERPAAGSDVGRAARARTRIAAREQLDGRLPQGGEHHGAPGCARPAGHGHRRPVRSRPLLLLGLRHARRAGVGLAVRRASPLAALHGRQGQARGRAVLPRRLANEAPTARFGRSRRATGRCRARRTRRARSCSCSTARCGSGSCSPRSR